MDTKFSQFGFPTNLSSTNAFGRWNGVVPASTSNVLDSGATSNLLGLMSNGTKRKWDDFNCHALRNSQLSSSSDTAKLSSATVRDIVSAKDTDDVSSVDHGINFQCNLNNKAARCKSYTNVPNAPTYLDQEPSLELQLSLSSISQSVVTNVGPSLGQDRHAFGSSGCILSFTGTDEGRTSSQWNWGSSLFPTLSANEHITGLSSVTGICDDPKLIADLCYQPQRSFLSSAVVSGTTLQQPNGSSAKGCQHPGCSKGARGSSGLCIAHGGGRRCRKEGCSRGAEGKSVFCKAHGGGRRCLELGCVKSAEGKTDYCIGHGGGRRCSQEGCTRAARGKSGRCIKHGGGKRCQQENCTKSAEGQSGFCIAHGGGRRCQYPLCPKGAQGSTHYCKAHGGGKRCTYPDCLKGAEGSTLFCKGHGGGKRCSHEGCSKCVHGGTQFCVAHGGGKRCAIPECTRSARGKTDYCVRHGGGKRCKSEGCSKSAQGSTDYCKAHGGGKRCSWGQLGSALGASSPPCDHFARGKIGLCRQHTSLVEDQRIHGGTAVAEVNKGSTALAIANSFAASQVAPSTSDVTMMNWCGTTAETAVSIPEGRVHGKSFMMLFPTNSSYRNPPPANQAESGPSGLGMWQK